MDLKLDAFGTAASLAGIIMTLKRLYRLNFETPLEMTAVLSDVNEQQALSQIAARAHARGTSRTRQGLSAD